MKVVQKKVAFILNTKAEENKHLAGTDQHQDGPDTRVLSGAY